VPLGAGYPDQRCAIAQSLGVLGERWTLLIIRNAMYYGHTRYEEFQRNLGVATNVLSTRLAMLVEEGILEQPDGPRGAYRLTRKGNELKPVLDALLDWGARYAPIPPAPPARPRRGRAGGSTTRRAARRRGRAAPG
jgi:DNA-binding HxlR family transcriptional regulator